MYSVTRLYCRYLDEWFSEKKGHVLDFGSGDGRLSLWALKRGFDGVLAVDGSLPALQRLVAFASSRGWQSRLLAVCIPLADASLPNGFFDVILCCEVLYYLGDAARQIDFLCDLQRALSRRGRMFLSEYTFFGRLLADVVALNLENLRYAARNRRRLEKFGTGAIAVKHPTVAELEARCRAAGLNVLARKGISPISMLFQHAYTFTSYPLRPKLGRHLQAVIDTLENRCSDPSDLSRNVVLLLSKSARTTK